MNWLRRRLRRWLFPELSLQEELKFPPHPPFHSFPDDFFSTSIKRTVIFNGKKVEGEEADAVDKTIREGLDKTFSHIDAAFDEIDKVVDEAVKKANELRTKEGEKP